jgi:IS30 family transposase
MARQLNASSFFAHPYSSWERGFNEYTNGLIRQYIPKKQSFNDMNDDAIKSFQIKINRRPRKLFTFEAPIERFFEKVALGT